MHTSSPAPNTQQISAEGTSDPLGRPRAATPTMEFDVRSGRLQFSQCTQSQPGASQRQPFSQVQPTPSTLLADRLGSVSLCSQQQAAAAAAPLTSQQQLQQQAPQPSQQGRLAALLLPQDDEYGSQMEYLGCVRRSLSRTAKFEAPERRVERRGGCCLQARHTLCSDTCTVATRPPGTNRTQDFITPAEQEGMDYDPAAAQAGAGAAIRFRSPAQLSPKLKRPRKLCGAARVAGFTSLDEWVGVCVWQGG